MFDSQSIWTKISFKVMLMHIFTHCVNKIDWNAWILYDFKWKRMKEQSIRCKFVNCCCLFLFCVQFFFRLQYLELIHIALRRSSLFQLDSMILRDDIHTHKHIGLCIFIYVHKIFSMCADAGINRCDIQLS